MGGARYDAVLLDAYGTLVELDDPFERLRESVRRHIGADVELEDAERAFRAEMAHYAGNCHEGADAESLAALHADCSAIILAELGLEADPAAAQRMLSDAVAFRLLPDVEPLLAGLARAEVPAAVVSNWDCTLRRTLTRLGLELDAIVTCGETGVRKPDPRFLEALGRLGVEPRPCASRRRLARYRCGGRRGRGHRRARRGSHRRIRRPGYHRIVDRGAGAPVNDRRLGTAAVHAGRLPTLPGDPVVEPVHRSVIYEFESAAEFGAIMADERRGYLYTRIRNPSTDELAAVIAEPEGAETAHCFASGMAALTALISVMAPPGAGVVAARQIYGQTTGWSACARTGPTSTSGTWTACAGPPPGPALVVVETLSNPNLVVADLPAICEVAHDVGARVLVDNTVATPVNCRPLEWGADAVMHSATKYLNGHSDVLAGVAAGREALMSEVRTSALELGATLSPDSAWLVRRGIRTLHLRVERAGQNAMRIAEFLEAHPRVTVVVYPASASHPAYDVARRILDGYGAMLAFEVEGGRPAGEAVMDRVRLCVRATSLGGVETCVSHPRPQATGSSPTPSSKAPRSEPATSAWRWGIEDANDLIEDLEQALR